MTERPAHQRPSHPAVAPYLPTAKAAEVLAFAQEVFGAVVVERPLRRPDGALWHAAVTIGDGLVMIGSAPPEHAMAGMVHVYVADPDATYAKALAAGAAPVRAIQDEPYGDRAGGVRDPGGNIWWIATFREHVPPDEIERRAAESRGA